MAFVKREIKDRIVQYPRRYQLVEVSPEIYDLVPVTGTVIEEGTPINKDLLQRYEDTLDDVAPENHASSGTTYGVGTTANFGHCKTINNLTQASHVNGNALSAYQGKVIKDLIDAISAKLTITRGSVTYTDTIAAGSTITKQYL